MGDREPRKSRNGTKRGKAGRCLGRPSWRCLFKHSTSELAPCYEITSPTRIASGPAWAAEPQEEKAEHSRVSAEPKVKTNVWPKEATVAEQC